VTPQNEGKPAPSSAAHQLKNLAFVVLRDVYHLGDKLAAIDADQLAERIHRIHLGLNPEKEFQALVSWLGQCTSIHAIEDFPGSAAEPTIRAPDYLVVSQIAGSAVPVLVEVKTTNDATLIWTDKYLSSLRRFAELLRLPLLVAWKRHDLWILVDTKHFELRNTAHHLGFERAMKENLMFLVCGEVFIELKEDFQFVIEGVVAEPLPPQEQLLPEATYTIKITDGGFFTSHGRMNQLQNEFFWLFNCSTEANHIERPAQQTIRAIHHPEPETMFPLSRVLLAQLAWSLPDDTPIDWNAELRRPFPSSGTTYRGLLSLGIELGVVRYVLQQEPHTRPAFAPNSI
jgi:hypothetical protein